MMAECGGVECVSVMHHSKVGKRFVRQLLNPLQVPLRQIVKLNLALPLPLRVPSLLVLVHRNGKFLVFFCPELVLGKNFHSALKLAGKWVKGAEAADDDLPVTAKLTYVRAFDN